MKISAEVLPIPALSKGDVGNFMEWVYQMLPLNMFQPEMIGYPRTVMCRASNGDEALLYVPLQSVLMFDAIAAKPGLTPKQEALALWRIGEVVDEAAKQTGHREVFFFCRDDRVADICARHGFEEIKNVRLMRKRVPEETK